MFFQEGALRENKKYKKDEFFLLNNYVHIDLKIISMCNKCLLIICPWRKETYLLQDTIMYVHFSCTHISDITI